MGNCLSSNEKPAGDSAKEPEVPPPSPKPTRTPVCPNVPKTPPPTSGTRVVALYDFDGRANDEITFAANDIMTVTNKPESDWWDAVHEKTGKKGFIPSNYVEEQDSNPLLKHLWYHGSLHKNDTAQMMRSQDTGSYLLRDSQRDKDQYVLVVKDASSARPLLNYKVILNEAEKYYITAVKTFDDVQSLINFYSVNDGLQVRLQSPVEREEEERRERDKWEIDRSTVQKTKLLGSGNFGEVYKGTWKVETGHRTVAIKFLKPGTMSVDKFLAEAVIMKELNHPKIVKLLAVVTTDEPLMIITEFMDKGDLRVYLMGDEGRFLEESDLRAFCHQVASGMAYLESQDFTHRDLAARNILVSRGNIAKLADFGLSRALADPEAIYEAKEDAKFPIKWTAPESIEFLRFGIKSDVWAFGITCYEIFTKGKVPYPGMRNVDLLPQLQKGYRMPKTDDIPDDIYQMMRRCWHATDTKRPSFAVLEKELEVYAADDSRIT